MCVRLIFVYRTAVHSQSVGKTDVRFGNTLNTVSILWVMLDVKETLNCAASLIVNNLPYLWH